MKNGLYESIEEAEKHLTKEELDIKVPGQDYTIRELIEESKKREKDVKKYSGEARADLEKITEGLINIFQGIYQLKDLSQEAKEKTEKLYGVIGGVFEESTQVMKKQQKKLDAYQDAYGDIPYDEKDDDKKIN